MGNSPSSKEPRSVTSPALALKEWALVLVVFVALFTLALSSYSTSEEPLPLAEGPLRLKKQEWMSVSIFGAVEQPGVYKIEKGSDYRSLINRANPLKEADLSAINLDKKLRKNQSITIPELGKISVFIEGAVENPGLVSLPRDSRVSDLKDYILLSKGADSRLLKKRRKLKHGERLIINSL